MAADKLANMGTEIEEGDRIVERGSAEPPRDEHKDNGSLDPQDGRAVFPCPGFQAS